MTERPSLERLWTPWRMEYIESAREEPEGCFLCHKLAADRDEASLIVARSDQAFVILNAFPYNPGHVLVAPFRHVGGLQDLTADELAGLSEMLRRAVRGLAEVYGPDGFNIGMNLGRVAGAGLPDHLHWHVVPRWEGDTNFMPVLSGTRMLPELLAQTYEKLSGRI